MFSQCFLGYSRNYFYRNWVVRNLVLELLFCLWVQENLTMLNKSNGYCSPGIIQRHLWIGLVLVLYVEDPIFGFYIYQILKILGRCSEILKTQNFSPAATGEKYLRLLHKIFNFFRENWYKTAYFWQNFFIAKSM